MRKCNQYPACPCGTRDAALNERRASAGMGKSATFVEFDYEMRMARLRVEFICALKSPQLGLTIEDDLTREELRARGTTMPAHAFYDSHGW